MYNLQGWSISVVTAIVVNTSSSPIRWQKVPINPGSHTQVPGASQTAPLKQGLRLQFTKQKKTEMLYMYITVIKTIDLRWILTKPSRNHHVTHKRQSRWKFKTSLVYFILLKAMKENIWKGSKLTFSAVLTKHAENTLTLASLSKTSASILTSVRGAVD